MTDVKRERKLKIEAELSMGVSPRELSERYNVPYVTILSWQKKIKATNDNAVAFNTAVKVDEITLNQVADKIKESAPPIVAKRIDKLVDGVTAIQKLEPKFHSMVQKLLDIAEKKLDEVDEDGNSTISTKDWATISNSIGSLYSTIFNKSGINVNVLNKTEVHSERLSMFKGTMRNS